MVFSWLKSQPTKCCKKISNKIFQKIKESRNKKLTQESRRGKNAKLSNLIGDKNPLLVPIFFLYFLFQKHNSASVSLYLTYHMSILVNHTHTHTPIIHITAQTSTCHLVKTLIVLVQKTKTNICSSFITIAAARRRLTYFHGRHSTHTRPVWIRRSMRSFPLCYFFSLRIGSTYCLVFCGHCG